MNRPAPKPRTPRAIAGCLIYPLTGDVQEASILFAAVGVIVAIAIYPERKTEGTLEAPRDLFQFSPLHVNDLVPGLVVALGHTVDTPRKCLI